MPLSGHLAADEYRAAFLVSVSEAERVVATSQPTPMPPHHKPLLNSQLRRTRLAGLTLHVCRFRTEEGAPGGGQARPLRLRRKI